MSYQPRLVAFVRIDAVRSIRGSKNKTLSDGCGDRSLNQSSHRYSARGKDTLWIEKARGRGISTTTAKYNDSEFSLWATV